jgi:G3E family GTPase
MAADVPIPVTVLTGFLGSGKTTLLNALLRSPAMEPTAVIVNEYNEVGIDDVLLRDSASNAVLLGNGCICCSLQEALPVTLETLRADANGGRIPPFRRVVVETTGLANPAPVMQTVMRDPGLTDHFRLGGLIATVDAVNGCRTFDVHAESIHQAAIADRIVITKTDIAPRDRVEALTQRLGSVNPGAKRLTVVDGHVDPAELLDVHLFKAGGGIDLDNWLPVDAPATQAHDHATHNHDIATFSVVRDRPIAWEAFAQWLEAVMLRRGPDLLRVKGIVAIAEQPEEPVVIHGVQDVFHPPVSLPRWPTADRRTRLVFITRNIKRAAIEATLRHFEGPGH